MSNPLRAVVVPRRPLVLLADEHANWGSVAAVLEQTGCAVELARDAATALARAIQPPPVTVVVARLRAAEDSAALIASLRVAFPRRRVPVVVVQSGGAGPP